MKVFSHLYRKTGWAALLAGLALAVGLGQPGFLALAQAPDEGETPAVELTVEPEATEEAAEPEPEATEEAVELGDPADTGVIDPPEEEELGEPVRDESYVSGDDVQDAEGGLIDIFDLSFVAGHFGSTNPAADVNLDGKVDIFDLSLLAGSYNTAGPENAAAAIATPEPMPLVESGVEEFGAFDLVVEPPAGEVEAAAAVSWRPLRIGVGVNYARAYDYMDPQTRTAPDLYAQVAVSSVPARTATIWNQVQIWPNWRLGWWRYTSFPWAHPDSTDANMYLLPVSLEIRDDDGWVCYGYYGCRYSSELADISTLSAQRVKTVQFYPSACKVRDENGVYTNGTWLDSGRTRCRVTLQSWGYEWPRAYVSYYIEGWYE